MHLDAKNKIDLGTRVPAVSSKFCHLSCFRTFLQPDSPVPSAEVEDIKYLLIPTQEVQEEGVTLHASILV